MPSTRKDLESYGAGTLRRSLNRAYSGSRYQYHFGLLDLDPANRKDMAASDVKEKEIRGICCFCNGSLVRLPSFAFNGYTLISDSACVSSILRLVNNVKFSRTEDVTFQLTPVALWTYVPFQPTLSQTLLKLPLRMAEVTSGILCGCLPVLPQLFHHYIPKIRKTLTASLRSKSQTRSNDSHRPKAPQVNTWNQALVKGNYIELDEHSRLVGGGRNQGARSETKVTAHRFLHEQERPATENEIYTERTITVE